MNAKLVRIGNSRGIRIPKSVIDECGLVDRVDLRVEGQRLVITAADGPRKGWDEAFARMAAHGDDAPLLNESLPTAFDETDWQW